MVFLVFFRWVFIANPVARLEAAEAGRSDYTVVRIPRAREVRQSYLSAVASFLWAFLACLRPVTQHQVWYQGQPFGLLFRKSVLGGSGSRSAFFLPPGSGSISQRGADPDPALDPDPSFLS